MQAVVVVERGKAEVRQVPKPGYGDSEVLVQVKAIGVNPTDYKHLKWISKAGDVLGCDFAGVVVEVGSTVENLKVGDKVAGFAHGGESPNYVASFEEASAFPVSAAIALFQHLGLPTPEKPGAREKKLLIWGASSYAGIFAIQLAKASGVRVVCTASPQSWDLLKSLGADAIFDYKDPQVTEKIREWAGNELVYGLDCISQERTVQLASKSMTGGRLVLLLSNGLENPENNRDVELKPMLLYTALGKEFTIGSKVFPASKEDYEWGTWWWKLCADLVKDRTLRAPRLRILGGLGKFETAFEELETGKVRAEKLILTL